MQNKKAQLIKNITAFLSAMLLFLLCYGQREDFYFKHYQVQDGLSSNTITSAVQDKKGFMWFGTRNGLNRFDGNTFKVFQKILPDSNSIGNNSILSLHEDNRGQLWVGTYDGIYIYYPQQERFRKFNLVPSGEIRFISEDKNHNIWIIDNFILYRYNSLQNKTVSYRLNNAQTISLHLSGDSILWAATDNGLVRHYQPETGRFIDYDIKALYKKHILSAIEDLYPINDSLVLIGTMNKVLLLNYKTNVVNDFFNASDESSDMHVHQIFRASPDEYWLGTENGIYILNIRTKHLQIVSKEYSNPYSITDNIIDAICSDKEGGIWIGTFFGGINYYSKQYNSFRKYFPMADKMSISGNIVHEICKDNYGHLWVGTEDKGLNCINLKNGNILHYFPDGKKGSISYHNIHGLVADGQYLWIGTYEHGLDVMDIATGKVIKHYGTSSKPNSLTSNFIVSLYRMRDGTILVGTWNGLFSYDRKNDNFDAVPFFHSHIQTIHEAEDGTIWVGTYGDGVYYQNKKRNIQGYIKYVAGEAGGLPDNYVNNLYEDSKSSFWFCTENGLSHYNPVSGKIKNYTTADGLPDNQIFRIMEDNSGNFWISTAKGLSMFNLRENEFTNYHTANGLPTEQFNYNSSFKDTDGTLYFGTVKGMIKFNPKDFSKNSYVPPVYITGLQINGNDAVIGNGKNNLSQSIIYTKDIQLPYNSNLSIDVAALSYIIPQMNEYAFKMDGIDKSWTIIKTNRKIFYTKLSPGKYIFRLKGSNSDGIWNNKETQLKIEILPPVWATIWAYLVYTLIAGTIIAVIIRYYHIATTEKHKRQIDALKINTEREVYNAKINFFTNVAHEIRTPLTLIKMPLDKLLNIRIEDKNINENLELMKKNTNRLIDLTNQLLDFRKAEADKFTLNFTKTDINELIEEIFTQFKLMAEEKSISYKLELPRITLHAYVDNEAVRKILTNIFNNAVKYCSRSVLVRLLPFSSEDNFFFVEVQNDGDVVSDHHKEKIFEPFFRIKENEKEDGTGIGLPLARSLAQLHRGDLILKTTEEQLNIFLLSLPIHQDIEINLHKFDEDKDAEGTHAKQNALIPGNLDKPLLLLVEDNQEILYYMQKELSVKYHTLLAANGIEALEILKEKTVQLVISDIMMPLMDGIELCRKIKTDLNYSHIPIILLTAKNSLQSKIEGLEVGADAYIEKPFSFEHLLAQIDNLMSNRKSIREHFAHYPLAHIQGIASSKTDKEFLEQLNDAIYAHITDDKLDVDQLSSIMNMSKATLYRKIKGLSELTPNELINITRLKKAAELLASGNHKVNEVAYMVGYSHPSNFTRDFQKQFGIIPSTIARN